MKTTASASTAKRKFVAGPAKITAIALPGGAASRRRRESASSTSLKPLSATLRAASESSAWRDSLGEVGDAAAAARSRSSVERAAPPAPPPPRATAPPWRAGRSALDVAGRRPVHPRDLHVAAERDRADPVLDPVAASLRERGREEDVELARPHLTASAAKKCPASWMRIEEGQAGDGDGDVHGWSRTSSRVSAAAVRRAAASASRARRGRGAARSRAAPASARPRRRCRGTAARPSRKAATATSFAALSTHGAVPPASPAVAREREARERVLRRAPELEGQAGRQVERRRSASRRAPGTSSAYEIGTRMSG